MRRRPLAELPNEGSIMQHDSFAQSMSIRDKLEHLRTQLVDLAFTLERRGQVEAADVAIATSSRIAELCEDVGRPERCEVALPG